jgi:hypothetical protein
MISSERLGYDHAGIGLGEGADDGVGFAEFDAGDGDERLGDGGAFRPRLAEQVVESRQVEIGIVLEEKEPRFALLDAFEQVFNVFDAVDAGAREQVFLQDLVDEREVLRAPLLVDILV